MEQSIPIDWQTAELQTLCNIEIGKTPSRSNRLYWDKALEKDNVWLSIADLNNKEGKQVFNSKEKLSDAGAALVKEVNKGTLLLSFKLTLGRVAFAGRKLYTNEAIAQLPIKDEKKILKEYLYYYLESFNYEQLLNGDVKVKGKTLNKEKLKHLPVSFPPLTEQERIVKKLDDAIYKIDCMKANAEFALSATKDLFSSHIDNTFLELAQNEPCKKLSDVAEIKGGKRVPKGYKLTCEKTPHPYIRVADFNDYGTVDLSDIHYISEDIYSQIKNYTISTKDLYISIAGTIGKAGIIPRELEGANLTENACKLVLKKDIYNRFVFYFSKTKEFIKETQTKTRMAAQPKLALSRLATIMIPVPSFTKQEEIVQNFDLFSAKIQSLEETYKNKIRLLNDLKQSILKQAFAGEL